MNSGLDDLYSRGYDFGRADGGGESGAPHPSLWEYDTFVAGYEDGYGDATGHRGDAVEHTAQIRLRALSEYQPRPGPERDATPADRGTPTR
ncbi:MAG TPA: hypothetical protein VIJ76_04090 [Galbitalea sp.]